MRVPWFSRLRYERSRMKFIEKIFGTHSQHELKRINPIVDKVMALDEQMSKLSDEELNALAANCEGLIKDRERIKRNELQQELMENLQKAEERADREGWVSEEEADRILGD